MKTLKLDLQYHSVNYNKVVFLKPIKKIKSWNEEGEYGYLTKFGSRVMVYRKSGLDDAGYLIVNESDLSKLFMIENI